MEKIFKIFNKEYGNINQAALLLGSFAFFSQVLGLIRDRLLAHFVGPGQALDIYYAAFRVPDFIRFWFERNEMSSSVLSN